MMSDKSKGLTIALLILSLLLLNICYASDLQSLSMSTYLNNTLLKGQQIPQLHSPAQINWLINATFYGLVQNIQVSLNSTQISYTDATGTASTIPRPLNISWYTNPELATYVLNNTHLQPVNVMSSNIVLGSVSQMGIYSSATTAPTCTAPNYYAEWDFYVTVFKNFSSPSRNVVVGRVCFYQKTVGYAQPLPRNSINQLSSTMVLASGQRTEKIILNYNSTYAKSPDGLVQAQWKVSHSYALASPPNGSLFYAVNNTNSAQWYLQSNDVYSRWFNQLYSFAEEYIPPKSVFYGPSSVGILAPQCAVVSTSNLTNGSVMNALACMNQTSKVYYTKANYYASQIVSSGQNMSNYPASFTKYKGKNAVGASLPSAFVLQPKLSLNISAQFTGIKVPAGKPEIFSVTASSLNTFGIGTIVTQVVNAGNVPALFNITLANCPGITTPTGVSYQILQGQGVEISTAIISTNTSQLINEKCTVVVSSIGGGGTSSTQVNVTSGPGEHIVAGATGFLHYLRSLI